MTLKEELLKTALMGAMTFVVKDINDAHRHNIMDTLLDSYRDTGNKSYSVALPDGTKVATITLNEPKPETVVSDPAAFQEWCKTHRPDLLEHIEHEAMPAWSQTIEYPATEAWTETVLKGAAAAHIVEDYKVAGDMYVTPEGEPVDGIEYHPADEPSRFTMTYTAKDHGTSVVQAWRDGQIPLELDSNLPRIGA